MKLQIATIPIAEAIENGGECPFCYIERKVEQHAMDFVLGHGASYMDYDVRDATDAAGFCRAHFKKMYDYGNSLGNAWILSTHYNKIIDEMDSAFKNFKPKASKKSLSNLFGKNGKSSQTKETSDNPIVNWINNRERSCYICEATENSFSDYIRTFFSMYKKEKEFRDSLKNTNGFCLTHFGILCQAADESLKEDELAEFYGTMLPIMRDNFSRVKDDVEWLIKKYDYRFKDEDWKNSKDANQRAMQKLKGGYPGDPIYAMKK